jgi:hypothetical protein
MNRSVHSRFGIPAHVIVALLFALYVAAFAYFQNQLKMKIASLAVIPVIAASWYFRMKGGFLLAGLVFLSNTIVLFANGYQFMGLLET